MFNTSVSIGRRILRPDPQQQPKIRHNNNSRINICVNIKLNYIKIENLVEMDMVLTLVNNLATTSPTSNFCAYL